MKVLQIATTPLPEKQVELIQTINSLVGNLHKYSDNLSISKTDAVISVRAELRNQEVLEKMSEDKDFILLCKTIRILGRDSTLLINGIKQKNLD